MRCFIGILIRSNPNSEVSKKEVPHVTMAKIVLYSWVKF
jgi:hypothetical protein